LIILLAERRKKTRVSDNDGKGAAGKNPRRGKTRPEPNSNEPPAPQQDGRLEGQSQGEPAPAQNSSPEGPRIALPGAFYQRTGRWWWRVQLPGEDKAKARPLKLDGEKTATADRETAGKIAFEMWEHAAQENAVRQIQWESTEKIERLKAQFLDKVRHFTELVETANAKIEAETKARAEVEAKLAQMAQGPEPQVVDNEPKAQDSSQFPVLSSQLRAVGSLAANCQLSTETFALQSDAQAGQLESAIPPTLNPPLEVGACECWGAIDVALANLKRIDSGQLLCPHCLAALRADVVRIESAPAE